MVSDTPVAAPWPLPTTRDMVVSIVESCGRGAEILAEVCMEVEGLTTNWMALVRTTAGQLCYGWGTEVGEIKRTEYIAPEATVVIHVRPGALPHAEYQEDAREQRVRLAEQVAGAWRDAWIPTDNSSKSNNPSQKMAEGCLLGCPHCRHRARHRPPRG